MQYFSLLLLTFAALNILGVADAGLTSKTTKAPVNVATAKPTEKPKNPIKTIAKAKIMGDPLTEQEWLNLVLGQLSPK
jgi:hypothetical protein